MMANIKNITIVTFISGSEEPNLNIVKAYEILHKNGLADELIIFSDKPSGITGREIREEVLPGTTKYARILLSLKIASCERILYIDNDITPEVQCLHKFITEFRDDTDLCFGRISVNNPETFTGHLIQIDKIISHKFTRPLLWYLNIGISVPGQVFMLRKQKFLANMPLTDTVFDDLAVGICAKQGGFNVQSLRLTAGYEEPSENMRELFRQRIRWARGYYEQLAYNAREKIFWLIVLHGISFHMIPAVIIPVIIYLAGSRYAAVIMCLISLFASEFRPARIIYAVAYFLIFPFVHVVWFTAFLKNLINGRTKRKKFSPC